MIAQRIALIIFAEQPTLFEDRHNPVDEVVEPAIQPWRHDVEAIGRTLTERGLYPVRHLLRRSGNHLVAAPAGKPVQQLPDRRIFPVDDIENQLMAAAIRLSPRRLHGFVRQRLVEIGR